MYFDSWACLVSVWLSALCVSWNKDPLEKYALLVLSGNVEANSSSPYVARPNQAVFNFPNRNRILTF
jgi:hypothetical protein